MFERLRSFFGAPQPPAGGAIAGLPMAAGDWADTNDPRFREWLRGQLYGDGVGMTSDQALRYSGVFRAVDLISGAFAMLPMRAVSGADGNPVPIEAHPATRLLGLRPSSWMTARRFKRIMMRHLLTHPKGAVARVVWSGNRPAGLIPLAPAQVRVEQEHYNATRYFVLDAQAGETELDAREVLHLRDIELPDARGLSRVQYAGEAVELALAAQAMALSMFRNGFRPGGQLTHPKQLGKEARARLSGLFAGARGPDNAAKWLLLEEGLEAKPWAATPVDPQTEIQRKLQIEESARFFGIPRPLMMMDDTSWGSGIEQLAHLFVRFCLNYWFTVWEDACAVTLLSDAELRAGVRIDVDESELLRGTTKDLGTFLARALGAGGQKPFMTANEARQWLNLPRHPDGDDLTPVMGGQAVPQEPGDRRRDDQDDDQDNEQETAR